MKLLFVLLAFGLSGCYKQIYPWAYEEAQKACKDHRGLAFIEIVDLGDWRALCQNGKVYYGRDLDGVIDEGNRK